MHRPFIWLGLALGCATAFVLVTFNDQASGPVVADVIDGDTLVLEDGRTVRLIGIDTPETVDPDEPVQCYGPEAHALLEQLVAGEHVRLKFDHDKTDDYGRTLAYVYRGDTFVNLELARQGAARYYDFEPNTTHAPQFHRAVDDAIDHHRGVWGLCPHAMEWATR